MSIESAAYMKNFVPVVPSPFRFFRLPYACAADMVPPARGRVKHRERSRCFAFKKARLRRLLCPNTF